MGYLIAKGSVNRSVEIDIVNASSGVPVTDVTSATAGLLLYFRREFGALTALTAINDLAALTTAHTDGGIKHIIGGRYRVDPQDAAWAFGVGGHVSVGGVATGLTIYPASIQLVGDVETPGVVSTGFAEATGSDVTHIVLPGTALLHPGMDIEVWEGTGAPWNRLIESWNNGTRTATIATVPTPADDTTKVRVWAGPSATDAVELFGIAPGTYSGVTIGNVTTAGLVTGAVGSVTGPVGSVISPVTAVLTSAYDFAKGTVAMTESYAVDGVEATPAQLLHMIFSWAQEKQIVGTTLTTKRLDGTTTAMTYTLNSATNPTSITRTS